MSCGPNEADEAERNREGNERARTDVRLHRERSRDDEDEEPRPRSAAIEERRTSDQCKREGKHDRIRVPWVAEPGETDAELEPCNTYGRAPRGSPSHNVAYEYHDQRRADGVEGQTADNQRKSAVAAERAVPRHDDVEEKWTWMVPEEVGIRSEQTRTMVRLLDGELLGCEVEVRDESSAAEQLDHEHGDERYDHRHRGVRGDPDGAPDGPRDWPVAVPPACDPTPTRACRRYPRTVHDVMPRPVQRANPDA